MPPRLVRKRPCSVCRKWFQPNTRVGDRQRVCSSVSCQAKRKRAQEAAWRRGNADYFTARRWRAATETPTPTPVRAPPPLDKVPWDVVQTQFEAQPAVIISLLGRVLVRAAQTQRRVDPSGKTGESARHPAPPAQTQTEAPP